MEGLPRLLVLHFFYWREHLAAGQVIFDIGADDAQLALDSLRRLPGHMRRDLQVGRLQQRRRDFGVALGHVDASAGDGARPQRLI